MQVASSAPDRRLDPSLYKNPDADPRGPYLLTDVTSPSDRPALQYRWRDALPPAGRSWRYTKERAEHLESEGRIVFSRRRPRLKRYLSEVTPDESLVPNAVSKLELAVRSCMRSIARYIAEAPECLRLVEWRDLERVLREVLEGLGFHTRLTRSGNDGGFDLELKYEEAGVRRTALVEVKHWAGSGKRPGRAVLRSLVELVGRSEPLTTGLLLSATGFTRDVVQGRTEIEQQAVRLGDDSKIVSLCQSYMRSLDGIWLPTTDQAEMLWSGTQ